MVVFDRNSRGTAQKNKSETVLKARAVSRGVGVGRIVCLYGRQRQFYRLDLKQSEIETEIFRFRAAVRLSKRRLKKIDSQKVEITGESKASIFDAHLLILEDKSLLSKIENTIENERVNSEWAIKIVTEALIADHKKIADDYLRERYLDIEDVADRLQAGLGGEKSIVELDNHSVIVAKDIKPSTLIELIDSRPQAIITERGGWTSHSFILARELSLPAVTGLSGILRRVQTGDEVIVDGFNGKIILHPSRETSEKFKVAVAHFQENNSEQIKPFKSPLTTLDGREIKISANVDMPAGYNKAKNYGARGIGLYRSEFLFNRYKGFPSEQEQIRAYKKVAESTGQDGVRIRTFDLNAEQLASGNAEKEQNPALGLRGIRLGLSHKKQFRIQLRALLQASADTEIDIVLPMISDISEVLQTKSIIEKEKLNLKRQKIKFGNPKIGAMIEVPATIFIIEELAREVDFFSLGTNDLVQYLLAVDRDNETVAECFRTLHPAVLRAVKRIVEAAEMHKIPVVVCGEMAGSPVYAAILVGLGATELSMNSNSILRVSKIVSAIAFEEAREITKQLMKCQTSDSVEQLASELFIKNWSHLFSPDILPVSRKDSSQKK